MEERKSAEARLLQNKMESEGFDYCFRDYSDWQEIEDTEFQKLREDYVNAAEALEKYVNQMK